MVTRLYLYEGGETQLLLALSPAIRPSVPALVS